jgi:hypothetical protein
VWLENYYEKEFSYLAALDKGREPPAWVGEEPYLEPAEEWLLTAYYDLGTGRGVDGLIPWRDMVDYADRAGLDPDVARGFVQIMRWVDADKLKRQQDKNRGAQEAATPAPTPDGEHTGTMPTASKEAMMAAARRRAANVKKVVR